MTPWFDTVRVPERAEPTLAEGSSDRMQESVKRINPDPVRVPLDHAKSPTRSDPSVETSTEPADMERLEISSCPNGSSASDDPEDMLVLCIV